LLPLLPRSVIEWLLEKRRYRHLRGVGLMRQLGALALAIRGEPATREHVRHILATTLSATRAALRRKVRRSAPSAAPHPPLLPTPAGDDASDAASRLSAAGEAS